jgi:Na+-transporting methylmalonyl-CoA/oxaloacetate decarboxylase gamma subunit
MTSTYGGPPRAGRRGVAGAVGVVLAILIAVAALIVAIVALNREPPPAAAPAAAPAAQQGPATDADRKLCEAIAPLMKENDDRSNAFLGTGQPGSPEQDAALPKFVTDTQDWARRTQQVLDANATPPRLLTRTLQRYIDDMQLFVASVRPGPGTKYDEAAWTDSIVAYGGPLATCQALGVQW